MLLQRGVGGGDACLGLPDCAPDPGCAEHYDGVEIIRPRQGAPTSARPFLMTRQGFCLRASAKYHASAKASRAPPGGRHMVLPMKRGALDKMLR
ncbi:hypothetical protein [Ralstonia solanacearum]|uniref:hypothetical protein n=1 Tax=Ralstonia solanacearum TaxID=305 RepID=UPI0012D33907|nr:hypothetical protein [Ralstonia solanacearum]